MSLEVSTELITAFVVFIAPVYGALWLIHGRLARIEGKMCVKDEGEIPL